MNDEISDDSATFIASGARISGPIDAVGNVIVAGRVDGKLRAGGLATVLPGGAVTDELRGYRVRIEGAVIGNVFAADRIEVHPGARVVGDLRAPVVELYPGASVEGRIDQRVLAAEALPMDVRPTLRLSHPMRRPSAPKLED
jgi:cytoskeletal protein CcmA (bactofilin family)